MKAINKANNSCVAVVTPVFNDPGHTLLFLSSLEKQEFKDFTAIIVDMGDDGTENLIKKQYPETVVLKEKNGFWSGGITAGVKYAIVHGFQYVYTANNDTQLDNKCLLNAVKFAEAHNLSLVGSMICYENMPEMVWYFGGYISFIGNMPHATGKTSDFTKPVQPEWLTGMGVLIPTQAFKDIGFYDAGLFPHYLADADFSLRAKKEGGYSLWVTPESRLIFDETSSWFGKCKSNPDIKNTHDLLFDPKSPMNLKARYHFFKRHLKFPRLRYFIFNIRYMPRIILSLMTSYFLYVLRRR